jgi:hypothetical protein
MSFQSMPWDGGPDMLEAQWREYNRGQADGFTDVGSMTFSNTTGTVTLSGARGKVQGATFIQSGSDQVTRPSVPSGRLRWDWIVLRYDPSANSVTMALVEGTPAVSNPVMPALEQHKPGNDPRTGIYEWPIGYITGGNGTASALPHGDLRSRLNRLTFVRSTEEMTALALNARNGDLAYNDDDFFYYSESAGEFRLLWPEPNGILPVSRGGTGRTTVYGAAFSEAANKATNRLVTVSSAGVFRSLTGVIAPEYIGFRVHFRIAPVSFGSQGDAVVAHGAPFTPGLILTQAYLDHDSGSVTVQPRATSPRWNDDNVFLRAKNTTNGTPYVNSLSGVGILCLAFA